MFKLSRFLLVEKETKNKIKYTQASEEPADIENIYLPKFLFKNQPYPQRIEVTIEAAENK